MNAVVAFAVVALAVTAVVVQVLDTGGGILVDKDVLSAMKRGAIVIHPFDRSCLGTNSYDVHLAPVLRVYKPARCRADMMDGGVDVKTIVDGDPLDLREPRETVDILIPADGIVLEPGELYLASTVEYTESSEHVPMLNGRSSTGRMGLSIHVTAGTGDRGFRGQWTMELTVVRRLRVRAGDPIGQLLWVTTKSAPAVPYDRKPTAKYNDAGPLPQPSKLHEEISGRGEG